jgi:RimJ/RimL family protein N-acetyltransferase
MNCPDCKTKLVDFDHCVKCGQDIVGVILRKCTKNDWDFILSMRNKFYKDSFYIQKKPLKKKSHYEYMKRQTGNIHFHNWIAMYQNKRVGYASIENNEVSVMVDSKFQGKKLGSNIIRLVDKKAKYLGLKLVANIRITNDASKKIFEKNGYTPVMVLYEKR